MKKVYFLTIILVSSLVFSACAQTSTSTPANTNMVPAASEKSGDTVKTGKITEINGRFMLQETGKQPMEIESYTIDLSAYVGKTVTVTGQYSGDTLFVGEIQ